MQTNRFTAVQAAARLRHLARACHISLVEIATVIIDAHT